jgi:MFS family permease
VAASTSVQADRFARWPADMRWNFIVLGADMAFFSFGLSISSAYTVLPLFVHYLTPSNVIVALIPAVRALGQYAPQLFVAPMTERRRRTLPLVLRLTILERVPYLLLAVATLLLVGRSNGLLLSIFFLMLLLALLGSGLCTPPWLDMIARSVPRTWIGRFFGLWTGAGGLLGVGGSALAAAIIARVAAPYSFAICFTLTFAAMVVSYFLLARGRERRRPRSSTARRLSDKPLAIARGSDWAVLRQQWRREAYEQICAVWSLVREDGGLQRLVLANGLAGVATMASAFFAVAALRRGGLSTAEVGVESTILFVGTTGGYFLWGAIGDRYGHRAVLVWGAICAASSACMAILAHGFWPYAAVFLLLGLNFSAVGLAGFTFITEFGPVERRPTYIALSSLAYAPFVVLAPVIGGWMADRWGYIPVFVVSVLVGAAAAAVYQLLVPDPRQRKLVIR